MPSEIREERRKAEQRYKRTEKGKATRRRWYHKHKEYQRSVRKQYESRGYMKEAAHARRIKREFGLTIEQYEIKLSEQNGVCAICRRVCATNRNLSVDHDHQTQKVRGLLCVKCNTMIGLADDLSERLLLAAQYLESWKEK